MQDEEEEIKGNTTDTQFSTSIWKQMRDTEALVDEKPEFEIDLRVEGVPQGAILKHEEQMKEISEKLKKLKFGSCTKSNRDDLKQEGNVIFIEESSRVLYEKGNMELFELKQVSVTI